MGNRLLATIIELEKSLQEEICQETERAVAWRERELGVLARELAIARQGVTAEGVVALTETRRRAEAEALRLQAVAQARGNRLESLPDTFLEGVLRRQLRTILPEDDDDHPHGQD